MSDPRPPLAGLVLAGGASRRMGTPKAALCWAGRSFLEIALERLDGAGCRPLVVVAGHAVAAVREAMPPAPRADIVVNPEPARGQLASLQTGLTFLDSTASGLSSGDPQGVLVSLIDQPAIRADTFAAVAGGLRDLLRTRLPARARPTIVIPRSAAGGRGHPVGLAREIWPEILALAAQAPGGLRSFLQRAPQRVVDVSVDDPAIHRDVDTPEDLARLVAEFATHRP